MKSKSILNTEIVRIIQDQDGYRPFVKMQDGGWLEMATYSNDLKGLVNALDLATNCAAGKFYPRRLGRMEVETRRLENTSTLELSHD